MSEYKPGDVVQQSSPLYRVVHDPRRKGEQLRTFYRDERFPPCSEMWEEGALRIARQTSRKGKLKLFFIR